MKRNTKKSYQKFLKEVKIKSNISKSKKIFAFDTEDDSKGNLLYVNVYDGINHFGFTDPIDFLKFIDTNHGVYYAHNLTYDLTNCDFFRFMYCVWRNGSVIFAEDLATGSEFRDTFNLSMTSLAKVGEVIGLPKLDIGLGDHVTFDIQNADHIKYCQRDTEIVYQYVVKFRKFLKNYGMSKEKPTLSGTAFAIFKNKFCKKLVEFNDDRDDFRRFYHGGRTEAFFVGEIKDKKIFCSDVNSLYPMAMLNEFPVTDQYYMSDVPETDFWLADIEVEMNNVDIPPFPVRKDKLIFPVGKFVVHTNNVEFNAAIKNGAIKNYKFLKVYNFVEHDFVFSGYIKEMYALRLQSDDIFYKNLYKLFMNSLYGRFAISAMGEFSLPFDLVRKESELLPNHVDDFGIAFYKEPIPVFQNLSWAIFITAYARVELYELLLTVKNRGGTVLYCDTDSVFYLANDNLLTDKENNDIGGLKTETSNNMTIYSAKEYIFGSTVHAKGVPKKNQLEYLSGQTVRYDKPIKYKEAALKRQVNEDGVMRLVEKGKDTRTAKPNEWVLIEKSRKNKYDKRIVLDNGHTIPLQLST